MPFRLLLVEFDARETTVAPLRLRQGNDHGLRQRVRGLGGAFRAIGAREQAVITREQTCAQSSEVVRAPPRTRASAVAVTLAASMRSCRPVIRVDVGVDVAVGRVVVMVNVVVKVREVTSEKSLTAMLSRLQLSPEPQPRTRWHGRAMAIGSPGALDSILPTLFGARRNPLWP